MCFHEYHSCLRENLSFVDQASKEARDLAWPKIMKDERMKPDHANMPFDG